MISHKTVLVLFGPTASGKTGVLQRLFTGGSAPCKAEIISADSMQVYRGMDIGTAKPLPEEREKLPHHLIDIRNPDEQFNAGDFVRLAGEAVIDIAGRGALPVVSGGTGFYLKNFILGLPEAPPSDASVRAAIREELRQTGAAPLREELARFDPISAERIHLNDEYRLLRAVEVLRVSGAPLSSFKLTGSGRPQFDFLVIGLFRPREVLYRRIDERCAAMFSQGLPGEVRTLYEAGYTPRDPGLRAIGYREFFVEEGPAADEPVGFRLSKDLAGVQELISRNSRRYAKRQITFFASLPNAQWIQAGADDEDTALRLAEKLNAF